MTGRRSSPAGGESEDCLSVWVKAAWGDFQKNDAFGSFFVHKVTVWSGLNRRSVLTEWSEAATLL
jgi:hypothetical protein